MPLASVATEPPNAVTARCCGTAPTISALSAPRIQAGKVNGSECTFSKPAAFSLASAHATARLWASVPARRCPISVVSDSTKSKAAGSLSAFCPRLDAVTTSDSKTARRWHRCSSACRGERCHNNAQDVAHPIAPSPIYYGLAQFPPASSFETRQVAAPQDEVSDPHPSRCNLKTLMVRSASSRVSNHDRDPAGPLRSSTLTSGNGVDIFEAAYRLTGSASIRSNASK